MEGRGEKREERERKGRGDKRRERESRAHAGLCKSLNFFQTFKALKVLENRHGL